ncbi:hypothetical protein PO909_023251 [Leuciscus waleckii]
MWKSAAPPLPLPGLPEVPEVRFRGRSIPILGSSVRPSSLPSHVYQIHGCSSSSAEASGYQGANLYRRQAYYGPVTRAGSSALRCRHWPHPEPGVETQHEKKRVGTSPENHVPGSGVGLGHDAGTIVSCTDRVHPGHGDQYKAFQRVLGLMAAASNVIPFGLLHMKALQWWLKTKGFSQKGNPFHMIRVTRRCLRSLSMSKKSLVSVPRPRAGIVMSPESRFDRCLPHGLGRGHGWQGSEELPPRPQGSPRRQCVGDLLLDSSGGSEIAPTIQIGTSDLLVIPGETVISQNNARPRGPESESRHPVEAGTEARGMETSHRGGEVDMREVRPSGSGFVRVLRDVPLSTVVFSHSSSPIGFGCHGTDVAETTPVREGPSRRDQLTSSYPVLAGPGMVFRNNSNPGRPAFADPSEEGPASTGRGLNIHPRPDLWKLWAWPLRGLST